MSESMIQYGPDVHGLRSVVLENSLVRVVVLPEAGAKVWQIHYKPLNADLLWNHAEVVPARHALHASYDDTWSGGWDELFPNDEAGDVRGYSLPDHGELWTGAWDASLCEGEDEAEVKLSYGTPISHFLAEKTLTLRGQSAVFEVNYKLTNQGAEAFPFLWKLHPAFAVSAQHRIDFPAMMVMREPAFEGSLEGAPLTFAWPDAAIGDAVVDLRQVPDERSGAVHFFYGTELASGWCGITNRANGLAATLRFDPEVFSSCWLFATHGGWKDLNVAVLEPATGYPFNMKAMIDAGQARWLSAGESLETTVLFSMQEGMRSIGGVDEDGRILAGDEK
jgi:hypothetical protein